MWPLLIFSLLVGVSADSYKCPTNVTCVEQETCCQTGTGLWACCPIKDGVCCDDGLHCCSKGQKCLPDGQCSSSSSDINFALPLHFGPSSVRSVPCPDGSSCPDGNTCCMLSSGQYGCCPLADAVCCSDHLHCCPHGYVCDVEHSRCKKQFDELVDVPCPGGSTACPDGQTCCPLKSGEYGCCPMADAVCCSDHLHCCPHGYTCDVEKGQCVQGNSIPWFKKTPGIRTRQSSFRDIIDDNERAIYEVVTPLKANTEIICPDGLSTCPATSTCCLGAGSIWGCCPIEKAICCSDGKHCCPAHYQCNLPKARCDHSIFGSIALLTKRLPSNQFLSALILSNFAPQFAAIQCPDQKSYCPEDTTCCELQDGSYGCCPYPEASCCADKIHCCGYGYACDDSSKRCIRHLNTLNKTDIVPSAKKLSALRKTSELQPLSPLKDQACPDGKTTCPSGATCCPNKENGQITYSCCPYPKGVCCGSNGSVCCPNGYTCDEQQLSCELSNAALFRVAPPDTDYSQCGTSDVACSYGQTCCRTYGSSDGEYACCNFPDAQCCEDGRHCCPKGTRCDVQSGGCARDY